jgi:hypothetical protein
VGVAAVNVVVVQVADSDEVAVVVERRRRRTGRRWRGFCSGGISLVELVIYCIPDDDDGTPMLSERAFLLLVFAFAFMMMGRRRGDGRPSLLLHHSPFPY